MFSHRATAIKPGVYTGSATTPLGYDGQYTNSDTGLIYLRARSYDPATAQYLSVDPLAAITGERYSYAGDHPVNEIDPTGLGDWLGLGIPSPGEGVDGATPLSSKTTMGEELQRGLPGQRACRGIFSPEDLSLRRLFRDGSE